MKSLSKAIVFIFVFSAILMPLAQLPFVKPETSSIADLTLAYIKDVLPIDTNAYNITQTDLQSDQADYSFSQGGTTTFSIFCAFDNNQVIQVGVQPQGAPIVSDRQYTDKVDAVRRILRGLQSFSGFDSTEMLGLLGMIKPQAGVSGVWDVTSSNNARLTINFVKFAYTNIESDSFGFGYRTSGGGYWTFSVVFSNGFFSDIQDLRMRDNYVYDNATVAVTKEQAINTALSSVSNYSYVASDGRTVSGFSVSAENTTANLLKTVKAEYQLHPCWTVVLNLSQTYPDNVSQLFVNLWADTGQVFAVGNLAETRYPNNTIVNPTPTPTSPSPSASSSPNPSASYSPSPSPSQTSNPTATPNPTNNPSPSQSLPPSQEPTSSPNQQPELQEAYYIVALVTAVVIIVAVALLLRNRHKNKN